jgi:hypothetical protein
VPAGAGRVERGCPLMKDFQVRIEKLRIEAAECDLVAGLATDVKKRELFERLARDYPRWCETLKK